MSFTNFSKVFLAHTPVPHHTDGIPRDCKFAEAGRGPHRHGQDARGEEAEEDE